MHRLILLRDLCAAGRLNIPSVPELNRVAAEAAPCVLITPLDCYWEGSYLQQPDDFIEPVNLPACLVNSPHGNSSEGITWGNIDFEILRKCLLQEQEESGLTPFINAVCLHSVGICKFMSLIPLDIDRCSTYWVCQ